MVREEKVRMVEELKEKLEKYPVIAIFDLFKLPTQPIKEIRKILKDVAEIKIVKKSLFLLAIEKCKRENAKKLKKHLCQQPGIIFANENPFKLFLKIENTKFRNFAKEGDVAEEDIVLKAGITSLPAGPIIGELTRVGIPVGVEGGRIAIKKDVKIIKAGEKFTKELASALRKLGIKPIMIGIKINCMLSNGEIYTRETLELVKEFPELIKKAYNNMLTLTINIGLPTRDNIKYILMKAYHNARIIANMVEK